MENSAVEWFAQELYEKFEMKGDGKVFDELLEQAKAMEKEHELKTKIICWKEALQFINDNYMVELINIRIYNMEVELETFKSE